MNSSIPIKGDGQYSSITCADSMQTKPYLPSTWVNQHSVLLATSKVMDKQPSYHTSSAQNLLNGDACTPFQQHTHKNYSAMTSLELYPTEQEESEILAPSDNFWNGLDKQLFEWNLLEEAAHIAAIVTDDKPTQKHIKELSLLTSPTVLSALTAIIYDSINHASNTPRVAE